MLGIAGSGMRGLAWLLQQRGKTITGTDSQIPQDIREMFNTVSEDDAHRAMANTDVVLATDAAPATHAVIRFAATKDIPVLRYHEALGEFSTNYNTVAVCGTHGKSSTTAFLAHIAMTCGLHPTALVGASVVGWEGKNAQLGNSNLFIVEADEYRRHFLSLHPQHIIVTSIDHDHPNYFHDIKDTQDAFSSFIQGMSQGGSVITLQDTFSSHARVAWRPSTRKITTVEVDSVHSPLPGRHMQQNAALAIHMADEIGTPLDGAQQALEAFPGLSRRFETIGKYKSLRIISDYGHHPMEISATLQGAFEIFPHESVAILFEAHTLERLDVFFTEFVGALGLAHTVYLYPPFIPKGREMEKHTQLIENVAYELSRRGVKASIIASRGDLQSTLEDISKDISVIIAFSAGVLDLDLRTLLNKQ